ncbi:competence type IV pilus major pilin ComGC [Oceanobacillus rekensis]|uniref:competence type IV pilus major pilin ComGC n=1 Tax=Oceanobacillus rekensis TaxID=937927 RepID=UPI000B446874|nr:competence type IV pilus major pilin ComGC [Oceanobacillus rekensis]
MFKNNRGFTLIEMLIVLMVISVLIILIVPNLGDKSSEVHSKGCEALASTVQSQVETYYIDKNKYPATLDELVPDYINDEQKSCQNNEDLNYIIEEDGKGVVSIPKDS